MQSKIDQFVGISFFYKNKKHKVEFAKEVNGRAVIKTDVQSFVKLESELTYFWTEIEIINPNNFKENYLAKELLENKNKPELVKREIVCYAEIVKANDISFRITEKLEAVFDLLAENPSDETYKKAKAMVDASNAIVNVQLANYKFLTLK